MITKNDLKLVERLEPLLDELSYEPDEDGTIPTDELDAKLAERGMLENYKNIVATFKLLKTNDDELKAYHYSLESLDYSINQEIEVR